MYVSFETSELNANEREFLIKLLAQTERTAAPTITAEPEPAKAAPAKKAVPAKTAPKPEPEPEPDEDLLGGDDTPAEPEGPTMSDAVAAATKLVSSGGAPKVKEALAAVGAKRVSEIPSDKIAAFLDALEA